MAKETILFPEEKIPKMVKLLREGIKKCGDRELTKLLTVQIKDLEEYWQVMQKK